MRILWFANTMASYRPSFNKNQHLYNGGGWIGSALDAIKKQQYITIGFCGMMSGEQFKTQQDGITFYPIPYPDNSVFAKILRKLKTLVTSSTDYSQEEKSWRYHLLYYERIIKDFEPDIIHVWGSEGHFGLISMITDKPVVLHIQGIINPCFNAYLPCTHIKNPIVITLKSSTKISLSKKCP